MRLSGLASGFDTDTMVQNLMRVERMKVDRFTQRRQVNLWRKESYNTINKNMANFILNSKKNVGLSKTSSTGSVMNQSYKNISYLRKAVSSNEDVATVTTSGKAAEGDFSVNIKSVAKSAGFTSGEITNESLKGVNKLDFRINGEELSVEAKNGKDLTIDDIVSALNDFEDTDMSAFYDKNTKRIFIQSKATDSDLDKMATDSDLDKIGEDQYSYGLKLEIEGDNNFIKAFTTDSKTVKGTVAAAEINGVEILSKDNKIRFNNLEIEAKNVGKTNISITTNTDEIVDKIQGLIDEYNSLIDQLSSVLTEERYPSYHPLSQEEKSEMKDRDVELWEEKARSGMLRDDEKLTRMLDNVRRDLYKNVEGLEGSFKNITEIGITTQKYMKGAAGGKLQIDESKLRAAIEKDADGVMELLFADEKKEIEVSQTGVGASNKGVFTGIYDNVIDGMKSIINESGPGEDSDLYRSIKSNIMIDFVTSGSVSAIDKDVRSIDRRIADLEVLLAKKEDSYYARFTAMEKYMYEMNSQADWLGQQMMMM